MASIQKIQRTKGAVYKVTIRQTCNGTICKTFPLKKQALEFARIVEGDNKLQQALGNPVTRALTLSILIKEYLDQYAGKDPCTYSRLTWWSNQYGNLSINKVSSVIVREGLKLLSDGNAIRGNGVGKTKEINRKRSGTTVNKYKANLSSIFEYGKEEYQLKDNPCREVKSKPENPHRESFLSDKEQSKLLSICKTSKWDRLYLLVLMALTTGARKGELLHLKWSDIDFSNSVGILKGTQNIVEGTKGTKNGKSRLLPLTMPVLEELKKFRQIGNGLVFGVFIAEISSDKTIIKKPTGKPFEFRKQWFAVLKEVGITNFRFHDLRYTAASNLAKNGATLLEIAEVLGHSNTTVTKRYAHLCIDHKRDLINRVMGNLGDVSHG
ncbi:MAG: site-specific integrase [gamma proteobacterium symbiont of Taylorina sp.]|nr:site-specific integrase [gamma proteobacterium symbiont of Taylorina sp.]